jgi:hypothetical protein
MKTSPILVAEVGAGKDKLDGCQSGNGTDC